MNADRHRRGAGFDVRYFRRDQSHRESHAQDAAHLAPVAAHPLASADPPAIITDAHGLAEMIEHLKAAGSFAFDSEFIGERSYEPLLCLVQAATTRRVFLVDPLAGLDLTALWELVASPAVEKVVLAGQQDFGPAVARTGRPPANIMDVQIAAGFVHVEYPLSLARLLDRFVGVAVGKAHSFTHWDNRPLTAAQARYAADDVRYLPAAREAIGRQLAALGRADWARQECAAALEDIALYRPPPEMLYLRIRGRERLGRRGLAVLRELAILRDRAARHEKVPARTLLKDGILLALSRRPAHKVADLAAVKGLPRPVEHKYGRQIVEASARALALPEADMPRPEPEEPPEMKERVDAAFAAIAAFCTQRSIAPALVASRKEVSRLIRAAGDGRKPDDALAREHRLMRGWRKELLGELVGKVLR
ncbi:MAG: ribonuclease D [Phycisphaerae bacterium]